MKKNEELLHSIGDIDEKYIENAKPKNRQKKKIVWISAASAAACLVSTISLMYYFVVRPINNMNNPGNSSEVITTEVTKTSEPTQTEKIEDDSEYPDVKIIDINHLKEQSGIDLSNNKSEIRAIRSSGKNLFIQDVHESTRENWCLAAEISSLDKQIVFPGINNITMNEIYGSDACFNDNYLYILLHGQLFSVSLDTDEIIAQQGGFHFEMDLSGSSECLGVDNDGNLYMESGEWIDDGYANKIIKYSPQLELISEYQTSDSIPFEHIINFDDMYIDEDNVLCCVYNNKKNVRINLSDNTISCEEEIIKDGGYWYVDSKNDNPLKTYTDKYIEDNSEEASRWMNGRINCIDSVVELSVNSGRETSFYKLDESGENLTEYCISEKCSPVCYGFSLNENDDILSVFSYETDGTLTDHINKYNMASEKSDIQNISRNEYYTDSDVISINDFNTDNDDNYYFSYMFSDKLEGITTEEYPLISRYSKNNYDEQVTVKVTKEDAEDLYLSRTQILINDNVPYVIVVSKNGKKSVIYKPDFNNNTYSTVAEVPGKLFSQSDGTILCAWDDTLYSYELDDGKMEEIFEFPQEVLSTDNESDNIQKINETSYAYIKGLAEPQSSRESETQLYLLTTK